MQDIGIGDRIRFYLGDSTPRIVGEGDVVKILRRQGEPIAYGVILDPEDGPIWIGADHARLIPR